MFEFNNSIVPNKVRIGWHFLSNKYAYRDAYSALKNNSFKMAERVMPVNVYQFLHELLHTRALLKNCQNPSAY